jgi:O-antigen ligase
VVIGGLAVIGVTFFNFELGLCLFLFGMAVIPHVLWNNLYSIAAITFYTMVYLIKIVTSDKYGFHLKVLDFFFLLFALTMILSSITSITPKDSLKTMLFYVTALLLVVILTNVINSRKSLDLIFITLFAAVVVTSVYAIYQGIVGVEVNASLTDIELNKGMPGRVYSTLENPNNYAEFLILLVPFCVAYVLNLRDKVKKVLFSAALILPIIALGLTYSRSGWIGFAIAVVVFVALKNWRLIPVIFVFGIIAIPFLPQSIMHRIMTIGNLQDTSNAYRIYIWKGVLDLMKDFWVTGIGVGPEPFSRVYANYAALEASKAAHSHMLFLEIWVEMGIAAFISFIWFLIRMVKRSLIYIYNGKDIYFTNILIAGIAALGGISFIGLVEYVWFYPRIMLTFWLVMGIMMTSLKLAAVVSNVL